ncbi:MAG: hypothetical protein ACTH2Q_09005 [Propionibacteriaceae bacterium]
MNAFDLLQAIVPSGFGIVAVVVVLLLVNHQRSATRARPAVVRHPRGQVLPVGAQGAPPAKWNARVFAPGDLVGEWGLLALADGQLSFTPDAMSEPRFVLSARGLRAQHRGIFRFGRSDLNLWLPDGTELGAIVSREKINRVIDNDFKEMRERGEAHRFLATLAANGALVLRSR